MHVVTGTVQPFRGANRSRKAGYGTTRPCRKTDAREGLPFYEWPTATEEQRRLAAVLMGGATLSGAQLEGATLNYAQLKGADLSYAQLDGADLIRAQLEGATLNYAQLKGACLSDAQLERADL